MDKAPELHKLSEDELYKRLGMLQSRLAWASTSSHGATMAVQIQYMMDEVTTILRDRMDAMVFEQNVLSKPAVIDIDGPKEKAAPETNTRAKSRSDIITRLRRTATPTTTKDA